jgi:hypothetical protein
MRDCGLDRLTDARNRNASFSIELAVDFDRQNRSDKINVKVDVCLL